MLQLISKDNTKSIKVAGTYRVHRISNGRLIINTIYHFFLITPPPKKKGGWSTPSKFNFLYVIRKIYVMGKKKWGPAHLCMD